MATMIGSATVGASTWGRLRCAFGNGTRSCTVNTHNVTYANGFKSAAPGSGLIRISPSGQGPAGYQPIFIRGVASFSPYQEALFLDPDFSRSATVEVEDQLTGETITFDTGSDTIDGPAVVPNIFRFIYQLLPVGVTHGNIVSIGKLTAF